jgi:predicted dehydrogenase
VSALDVLVVGAGAYVRGAGERDFGTVLPALLGLQRDGRVGALRIAATRPASVEALRARLGALERALGQRARVELFPQGGGPNQAAYLEAAERAPRPRAALVVVPDPLHHRVAASLLERGLHCLVVKPLAPTAAEARDLARRARERGLVGEVEFHKRFDDANRVLRRELASGSLGEISSVLVEYSQRRSVPLETFRRWAHHTNSFQYLGVHYVDLIHFASGARPRRATAAGRKDLLARRGVDTWDSVHAIVEWETPRGGAFHSVFHTSWIDPEGTTALSNQILKVIGTRGRFESDQKHRGVELATAERCEVVNPYFSQLLPGELGPRLEGYGPRSIEQFLRDAEARESGASPETCAASFEEGVLSSAVCEAVSRSLRRRGRWIDVDLEGVARGEEAASAARAARVPAPPPAQAAEGAPLLARS